MPFQTKKLLQTLLLTVSFGVSIGLSCLPSLSVAQSLPLIGGSSIAKASSWSDLSTVQKEILATLEDDWGSLSVDQRVKWIQLANRYDNLSESEKERLKSRMADWAKLSITERRLARANYLKALSISNDRKLEAWEAYQQLTPEEKKLLTDEALAKSKNKKTSIVNSPTLKTN